VTYRLDKVVNIWTSRDNQQQVVTSTGLEARPDGGDGFGRSLPLEPAGQFAAQQAARHLDSLRLDALMLESDAVWQANWEDAGVQLDGADWAQHAVRFAMYHLMIAANPEDEHVSISARTLSGLVYKGHVFWDTEIFMLPFFTFTDPRAARSLLMYRYWTLPGARDKARTYGYRGAMYAWESADLGTEATPTEVVMPTGGVVKVMSGIEEHHISADIAYAVWQYWRATGDDRFMNEYGAEIVLECARFWSSRVQEGQMVSSISARWLGQTNITRTSTTTRLPMRWLLGRLNAHRLSPTGCRIRMRHPGSNS
jgi:trehalose/maltose hydrolase-like predicted phosphorylase